MPISLEKKPEKIFSLNVLERKGYGVVGRDRTGWQASYRNV
jgi:hypothetical protein